MGAGLRHAVGQAQGPTGGEGLAGQDAAQGLAPYQDGTQSRRWTRQQCQEPGEHGGHQGQMGNALSLEIPRQVVGVEGRMRHQGGPRQGAVRRLR